MSSEVAAGAHWQSDPRWWGEPVGARSGWEDHEAVRLLESSYCHITDRAMNCGRTPDLARIFHPEAIYRNSFQPGMVATGRDAVANWYHDFLGRRLGYYRHVRHKIFEPLILVDGYRAQSSALFDADSVDRDDNIRTMSGVYDDLLVKRDGRWLIKERFQTIYYHHTAGKARDFGGWR